MNVEATQKKFDKKFPKGTHVWMDFGDGSGGYTFLIPRVLVTSPTSLLLSPFNETIYFEVNTEDVDLGSDTVELHSGQRTYRLSAATERAQEILASQVKTAFASGFAEERRK